MKTSKVYCWLPALGALALSSCVLPGLPQINLPPIFPILQVGSGNSYPYNNGGYAYYHDGRYYHGGRYESGNYTYRGSSYNNRYYHNGRYYYGGSHEYHDGDWYQQNRSYRY